MYDLDVCAELVSFQILKNTQLTMVDVLISKWSFLYLIKKIEYSL